MKYIILLLIILLASIAYAEEEIFSETINQTQTFTINNLDYSFRYSFTSSKALIECKYSKLIIDLGDCKQQGYLEFCFKNTTFIEEGELTQFLLTINEEDCIAFQSDNGTACKYKIAEKCSTDYSCESNKCLHGICTFRYPLCGDGYCDKNEKCKEDCDIKENITEEINETIVNETIEEIQDEPEEIIEEQQEKQVIVETLEPEETKPINTQKIIIWIAINAIIISVGYMVGYTIYKKRKASII